MSGLASIGLFLSEQTVRKTIMAPLAGSRAGKCTGVLRCDRSFILSEGHALSCPRCLSCPGYRVDFIASVSSYPVLFRPRRSVALRFTPNPRCASIASIRVDAGSGLWLDAVVDVPSLVGVSSTVLSQ